MSATPTESGSGIRETLSVFKAAGREYSVADILGATAWRGEFAAFSDSFARRLAAAAAAEAAGLAPDPSAVEAATADFRYARDLVSADECERWLAQRGLTFSDLNSSVTRRLQAGLAHEADPTETPPPDPVQLRTEALLADEFSGWARELAWRVALALEENCLPPAASPSESVWAVLEQRHAAALARLAEPARRKRELGAQRLALLQTELALAEFGEESAAREAFLCVREDGETLAAVAAAHGFSSRTMTAFLSDLPPEWQQALLGAAPGDVLPPEVGSSGALVVQLVRRREPSIEEQAVTERLDAVVRRHYFGELETRHIRWLLNVDLQT